MEFYKFKGSKSYLVLIYAKNEIQAIDMYEKQFCTLVNGNSKLNISVIDIKGVVDLMLKEKFWNSIKFAAVLRHLNKNKSCGREKNYVLVSIMEA